VSSQDLINQRRGPAPAQLADVLERILDKGIVIAGDIQINLLDIELLTIKLRLIIAGVDKAREIGINWWETDPMLNAGARRLADENHRLRQRVDRLEHQLERPPADALEDGAERTPAERGSPAAEDRDG
jgi:Gas vesicle protein